MFEYKERKDSCGLCSVAVDEVEHTLFHKTGVSSSVIKALGLTTELEIEDAFRNAIPQSKFYILLNGRKTKIREKNKYIFPEDIINLIPNLQR